MKKIFVAATIGLLFSLTPVANAEIAPSNVVQKPDVNFCAYAIFAQKKLLIRNIINQLEQQLKENPDDAKTRQKLAAAWHELGKLNYAAKNYTDALAAFEKAVELAPDNEQFRRDRDDARDKVNSGAEDDAKRATPKFNGLG